ncbi:assimilatory nitrate reductase (NADH) beta subunit [Alteromonadaceae bacterium Bs31]|nr:assimilatory nitrate reductase (NADH) beta subunit [Alteromonadaceae bacterium Bs31]
METPQYCRSISVSARDDSGSHFAEPPIKPSTALRIHPACTVSGALGAHTTCSSDSLACKHWNLRTHTGRRTKLTMIYQKENSGKTQLLIVGNGMASGRLLDEILRRSADKFSITVVGDEIEGSYNRILLSSLLAKEAKRDSLIQKDRAWYESNNIRFISGQRGEKIDHKHQQLILSDGSKLGYQQLVLATGSRPARIPAKNQQLQHIYSFRTLADADTLSQLSTKAKKAVVVGGGLLGLEAAYGLAQRGLKVVLVHRNAWPLNRQLDAGAGDMLRQVMEQKNIQFQLGTEVETFIGEEKVSAAQLSNGERIRCDLAVIATGITPNKELGEASGLSCKRAIQVDHYMKTSAENVSALGECCECEGASFGLVEPIWHQCVTLADRLCFDKNTPFVNPTVATKLKVSGVQVFSAGKHLSAQQHREIVLQDRQNKIYRKLLVKDGKLDGIVLFGDTRSGNSYFEAMQKQSELPDDLSKLLLGDAFYTLPNSTTANPPAAINE